ncbi:MULTISPECIES: DUF805 domain-containing protein [unclassified Ruegeria]|uniref:DUF805 domain-containing protein n=1 Tax=unclassified Ruegeria TaxID=2625375 RepID=UPI001ADC2F4D|nr:MULTISPECIES: DUF805 domain-containing protein [unclassified Ruegeria]MBO9411552.1 DUF805 domain-containing protein [Ruegeria sp. R8_1]MBO9415886.1 DUF805 domain-containing protein [Ruegeria sp. R8_2]
MGPRQAISTGFRKAFVFSGRASRAEFWWFAPIASVLPISVALLLDWRVSLSWEIGQLFVVMMASLPLLSAMSRRLQDTDEDGYQAIFPFMPIILFWLGYQLALGFSLLIGGPILWFILAVLTLVPAFLASLVASVMVTSNIIGMMLVASDSDENRFGAPSGALPS